MRKTLLVVSLALAGCAAAPPPAPITGPGGSCNAEPGQAFVGQTANAETGQAIRDATGSRILRWAAPNTMMTMEFSAERVTVHYGADMRITKVVCG